ncbi:hypothetical protein CKAN_02401100 [Cinnamomum micranthum f. kanehirae]|uniref:DUF3444 domain-containing protein n=1 Tax=Cinnamomum micranthum f. kanehirae TaxID=337451 RepID=A0A3S4PTK1_9MAGN|nr:hypothetical protein CKAN_02401100 [Cinnamomum micranthum f. kanehirae]
MRPTPYTTSLYNARVQSETNKENGREQAEDKTLSNSEPEFTNLDKDRTESQFASDQIWATYDTNACMTFRYNHDLIQTTKMRLDWVLEDLPFACGNFKNDREGQVDFSLFSYLVSCDEGERATQKR